MVFFEKMVFDEVSRAVPSSKRRNGVTGVFVGGSQIIAALPPTQTLESIETQKVS
jgi:hypothetical protein